MTLAGFRHVNKALLSSHHPVRARAFLFWHIDSAHQYSRHQRHPHFRAACLLTYLRRCPLYRLRRIQSEAPSSLALAIHVDFGKSSLAPQAETGKRLRKVKLPRSSLSRMLHRRRESSKIFDFGVLRRTPFPAASLSSNSSHQASHRFRTSSGGRFQYLRHHGHVWSSSTEVGNSESDIAFIDSTLLFFGVLRLRN